MPTARPGLLAMNVWMGGSHDPNPWVWQRLTEFRKIVYLLDCWFIIKGYNSVTAKRQMHRARYMGRGAEPFHALSGWVILPAPPWAYQPELSKPHMSGTFMEAPLTGTIDDLCNHWPLPSDPTSSPSLLPGQGRGPKVSTLSIGSPSNQPSSCGYQGAF